MSDELPGTVRDLRVQVATAAARAGHVFNRTITTGPPRMPRPVIELNLIAHTGYAYGFALAEVLRRVEERDPVFAEELLHLVNDIAAEGDDGRCADIWPDVEQKLTTGGVGTPQWDTSTPETADVRCGADSSEHTWHQFHGGPWDGERVQIESSPDGYEHLLPHRAEAGVGEWVPQEAFVGGSLYVRTVSYGGTTEMKWQQAPDPVNA